MMEEADFAHTMPNLDFTEIESKDAQSNDIVADEVASANVETSELPELNLPSDLTLDMPASADAADETADQGISLEASSEETSPESFGFDIDTLTDDTIALEGDEEKQAQTEGSDQANVLDMSGISLDVNDDVNQAITEATQVTEPEVTPSEPESEEVETKLELVAAYIDMEDKEGAKELLDEVLKEGGTNQRKRAEDILATLS